MKYVGIVSRVIKVEDMSSSFMGISERYRKVLAKYPEITPILLLPPKDIWYGDTSSSVEEREPLSSNQKLADLLDLCDGFIVPGGSRWFSFDEYVVEYALRVDKPILGICLGMQIMGVVDNKLNSSIFDFVTKIETGVHHQQSNDCYAHEVFIREGSKLENILGVKRCKVNSHHQFCLRELVDFEVSAYSNDRVVEAIEHPKKTFAIGVQWHPEIMISYDSLMDRLFASFVSAVLSNSDNTSSSD